MSEQPVQGQVITSQLIASLAARTALETPGVLRLEPTIQGFLARLGPAALQNLRNPGSQNGTYRHDGVTATISDGTARVHLDIATDIAYTALNVAEIVQHRVRESISHTGLTPGRVDISILAIEPQPRTKLS
ncbi:Asp23/Gls24 family envelope stress response protein [Arthrobacter sp. A5]|uniref:Asp23/Gls24 family envelope stress response protein n=1 Tax=Arthrobacter sp. A5 TaxID=576926 RepID=UPI003DA87EC4